MPIYRITFPNRTPVDVQGVSITTEIVQTLIPPSLPTNFYLYATRRFGSTSTPSSYVVGIFSYSFPTIITYERTFFSGIGFLERYRLQGTNNLGQTFQSESGFIYCEPGTAYITPGQTTVTRCDALITTATGNVLRLQGTNGQSCPTWVTTPDNECRPDEIKCTDLSDPRGFCCVPCDVLNTKIRVLI